MINNICLSMPGSAICGKLSAIVTIAVAATTVTTDIQTDVNTFKDLYDNRTRRNGDFPSPSGSTGARR